MRLVPWLVRRRARVLGVACALSLVALAGAVHLYRDLRSGLEELLPESAPSVEAVRTVLPLLHSNARLTVGLEGSDPQALERFADLLALRLLALPVGLVESIDFRSDEQDAFLQRFGPLYLPIEDLRAARIALAAMVFEANRANPLLVDLDDDDDAPAVATGPAAVDLAPFRKYEGLAHSHFRGGYFQTPDGHLLVLQVVPPEYSTGVGTNQKLIAAVQAEVATLNPKRFDLTMTVGYSGEIAQVVEQQAALVADLLSSTVVVLLLVLGALWLYFRRWGAIGAISGALACGCALTFGLAWPMVGHLNANTAFLGSIVIGNGINVGIIFTARYLERRSSGLDALAGLIEAFDGTLGPTFVAAFGAGLAYLSLAATDFRGFSQFGLIGALGMSLCWVTAYLLLPPLLSYLEGGAIAPGPRASRSPFSLLARLVEARPRALLGAALLLTLGAGVAVRLYHGDLLEADLAKIGARHSLKNGALFWSQKANEVFQASRSPIMLHAATPAALERTLARLEEQRRALGKRDPIREVVSVARLAPPLEQQAPKLAVLSEIRALLSPAVLARIPEAQRPLALEFARRPAPGAVALRDAPKGLRRALTERDGTVGRIGLIFPVKPGKLDLPEIDLLKKMVRGAAAPEGGQVRALHTLFLLSDIDDTILRDAPKATLLALGLVCALVLLVLRNAAAALTVIVTLLFGVLLLVGGAAAATVRVNFLNFVVLPITFGIGVDYAVNIVLRWRQEPAAPDKLERVLRETGSAVALCSATTIIGYASLVVADSQALAGFGLLAALGEVTCLGAALLVLPAWLCLRGGAREAAAVETTS